MVKKSDNWSKVSKDPEELPYMKDLTASLPCSGLLGRNPFSPGMHLCLRLNETVSLCALPLVVLCL